MGKPFVFPTNDHVSTRPPSEERLLPLKFPSTMQVRLSPAQRIAMEELADQEPHENDEKLLEKVISRGIEAMREDAPSSEMTTHAKRMQRCYARDVDVENYIGIPLEERLRRKLEAFLRDHPDAISEEEAAAMLLDLGLRHVHRK